MLMMLQCCLYPSAACCDLHAVFCWLHCNAVGLELVDSSAAGAHLLHAVTCMLCSVGYTAMQWAWNWLTAVLLVPICCML